MGSAGKGGRADLLLLPLEQNVIRYQLFDVPIKELSHRKLLDQTTALGEKFEGDPVAFLNSVEGAKPSPSGLTIKDSLFRDKPGIALTNLNTEVTSLLEQVNPDAIKGVFVSLLGYYFAKAGEMRLTRRSMLEALQDWTTEACGLPKAPFVSDALLAKMGGMDGRSPARTAKRGPFRSNFGSKPSAMRYTNNERNRRQNERTGREFARGRRWEGDENGSSGSRRSGRGSRFGRGDSERPGSNRSGQSRDNKRKPWF